MTGTKGMAEVESHGIDPIPGGSAGWLRSVAVIFVMAALALAPVAATAEPPPEGAVGASGGTASDGGGSSAGQIASDAGLGVSAFLISLVYAPFKVVYATGGLFVGSLAWVFSGGSSEAAGKVMRPALAGDYLVTPSHLRGEEPLEFIAR